MAPVSFANGLEDHQEEAGASSGGGGWSWMLALGVPVYTSGALVLSTELWFGVWGYLIMWSMNEGKETQSSVFFPGCRCASCRDGRLSDWPGLDWPGGV